jgi:signal transduction histidine kinase
VTPPPGRSPTGDLSAVGAGSGGTPALGAAAPAATDPGRARGVGFQGYLLLTLSSLSLMALVFLVWELVEQSFFVNLDYASMHYLYVTRGMVTGGLMAAWAAWFVLRQRSRHEMEERHLWTQLMQAEKLASLGELVGGVAHEINNPIGIMSSRLELMRRSAMETGLPPAWVKDIDVIQRQTARIAETTQSLLNFARKAPMEFRPVSLNDVANSVLDLLHNLLRRREVSLATELVPALPLVSGNRNHLEQVVLNLVKNALDALEGRPDPRIRVATWFSEEDQTVRLHVSDNGPGIPDEALGKVFDPFFTTKKKGTGLGLAVSYGIIRQHGGEIAVQERGIADSCGTCFLVSLPVLSEKSAIDAAPAPAPKEELRV